MVIRTNYIITKIDKTQQNSKCRLCADRDETINHIIMQQICAKRIQDLTQFGGEHDLLGIVQEI